MAEGPRFSQNEAEVLKLLDIPGGMKAPQLAEALGIGRQAAYERLRRMRDLGYVRFDGDYWQPAV